MNEIIFIKIEGRKKAFEFILDVDRRGKLNPSHPSYLNPLIAAFIVKGLEELVETEVFPYPATDDSIPWEEQEKVTLVIDDNNVLEQALVKSLAIQPIYEFRIDVNRREYFRAIFFPFHHKGKNYYCFTDAFIKVKGDFGSDKTNYYRNIAKTIYENFRRNPSIFDNQIIEQRSDDK